MNKRFTLGARCILFATIRERKAGVAVQTTKGEQ